MWVAHHSDPEGERLTPEQVRERHRRWSPPENEFPAGAGLTVLLGRTDNAAVGITHVEAFSTGFRFTMAVRLREVPPEFANGGVFALLHGYARPGLEVPLERRLLLGLEYSDGRRASTLTDMRMTTAGDPPLMLVQQGGGGDDRSIDQSYWVSPLPPEGPIVFVLAWPVMGIPEGRTVLDAAPIRAAAERVAQLWPMPPPAEPPRPPDPPRPSTGWFADPPD